MDEKEKKEILLDIRTILKKIKRENNTMRSLFLIESLIRYVEKEGNFSSSVPYFKELLEPIKLLSSSFDEEKYFIGLVIKELIDEFFISPFLRKNN